MFTHFYDVYKGSMIKKLLFGTLISGVAVAAPLDSRFVSVTPTVDTSIYASGDVVGGLMTFTGALSSWTGSGIITGALIADKSAVAHDLELHIFESLPASTFTDQAAFDPDDADLLKEVAVISFGSTSRYAFSDNGVKYLGSISCPVRARSSSNPGNALYGVLVSRGTPTFTGASDITVRIAVTSD